MLARVSFIGLLLGTGLPGCNFTTGSPSCPTTTVILDAGVDGMPDVGEYASWEFCQEVCWPLQSACCRVKELVFRCEPACI